MRGERGLAEVLIVGVVISSAMWVAAVIGWSTDVGGQRYAAHHDTEVASRRIESAPTCDAPARAGGVTVAGAG